MIIKEFRVAATNIMVDFKPVQARDLLNELKARYREENHCLEPMIKGHCKGCDKIVNVYACPNKFGEFKSYCGCGCGRATIKSIRARKKRKGSFKRCKERSRLSIRKLDEDQKELNGGSKIQTRVGSQFRHARPAPSPLYCLGLFGLALE